MEVGEPKRCWWCGSDPVYVEYHDRYWGRPRKEDSEHFEMLALECFQSGLSWITIWKKRDGFRRAFADWNISQIARFGAADQDRLMGDASIVRNRAKIEAVIHNARRWPELLEKHGSFEAFAARFQAEEPAPPGGFTRETLPLLVPEAHAMSKALKKLGFKFTGPMVCMSYLQAVGFLNHHLADCFLAAVPEASNGTASAAHGAKT